MKSAAILCCVLIAISMAEDEESATKLLHKGNIDFSSKFYQDVVKAQPASNVIMSAYSVLTPLAQLSLASEGDSQKELLGALELPNTDVVKVAFKAANKKIHSVEGVTLKTASRIYVAETLQLNKEFNAISKDVFQSDVKNVNFKNNVAAAADINEWVESQTNNLIKDLVSPSSLNDKTTAILVNAIYFKGKWATPFDEKETKNKDFFTAKDQKSDVPMMFQKNTYLYASNSELNAQLLEIPYVKKEASFLIVLPNEVDGISSLEEKLKNPNMLTAASEKMYSEEVNLHLPKFKIETTIKLKDVLESIGVKKIFTAGEANLTKLLESRKDLFISEAIQKAFIEVNEEGAEAAAANEFTIEVESLSINPSLPIEFNANHPFIFAIKLHNDIIFNGVFQ